MRSFLNDSDGGLNGDGGGGGGGGCGASLPDDPALAFCEFSFRKIPRDNCVRRVCIRIVLNP